MPGYIKYAHNARTGKLYDIPFMVDSHHNAMNKMQRYYFFIDCLKNAVSLEIKKIFFKFTAYMPGTDEVFRAGGARPENE